MQLPNYPQFLEQMVEVMTDDCSYNYANQEINYWIGPNYLENAFIKFDFGKIVIINKIFIRNGNDGGYNFR